MDIKPWRAKHFAGGYSAEYLRGGYGSWRIVKDAQKKPVVFPTFRAAREAAEDAYLHSLTTSVRATIQIDPEKAEARMEAKMLADAESWLKSKREDVKRAETVYRPGRKKLIVMSGRSS